jgi:hypothetical protein
MKTAPQNKSNKFDYSRSLHFIYTISGTKLAKIFDIISVWV